MKPVLAWIKSNLLIVVFLAIIVIVLPGAYFGSSAWGGSIRSAQEKAAGDALSKVNAGKVDYAIPQYDPASPALVVKAEPNTARTAWFKQKREEFAAAAGAISQKAADFNRGVGADAAAVGRTEHLPIVEGLFPGAEQAAEAELRKERGEDAWGTLPEEDRRGLVASRAKAMIQDKLYEAEEAFLGKRGRPNPYQKLLDGIRAGGPVDAIRLVEDIKAMETSEIQKIGQRRDLTADERARVSKLLEERRLGGVQARAKDVSVFATLECLPTDDKKGSAVRLDSFVPEEIRPYNFFVYQWDLWLLSDMFSAVGLANRGADGRLTSVDQSTVKRIVSMELTEPKGLFEGGTIDPSLGMQAPVPTAAVPGMVPTDPTFGLTARGMGEWNTFYDLRNSAMTCIVASRRLPDFFSAIERTNFMTVTSIDVSEVNAWEELKQGYYYGADHVVKVRVEIESVWLRSWMTKFMPLDVQGVLKVPGAPAADPAAAGTAAAPAPVAPAGGPVGGSRGLKGSGGVRGPG